MEAVDMQNIQAETQILKYLHRRNNVNGIFMSFWINIPKTNSRAAQIAHLAILRNRTDELITSLIPVNYFPPIGSSPPWTPDLIFPHSMMSFIRNKMSRYGIIEVVGAISEREIPNSTLLTTGYIN
jgi:hypothetical protein